MEPIAMKTECGTAMCIAGHTLVLAGYKMRLSPDVDEKGGNSWPGRLDYEFTAPNGRTVKEPLIAAAKELEMKPTFGSNGNVEAYDLFHDFSLKTPKDAAARIQELIESAGKP